MGIARRRVLYQCQLHVMLIVLTSQRSIYTDIVGTRKWYMFPIILKEPTSLSYHKIVSNYHPIVYIQYVIMDELTLKVLYMDLPQI